jgi:hypothetical protein
MNADKYSRLTPGNKYAYDKVRSCILALDRFAGELLNGSSASGELVAGCSELEKEIGRAMFG